MTFLSAIKFYPGVNENIDEKKVIAASLFSLAAMHTFSFIRAYLNNQESAGGGKNNSFYKRQWNSSALMSTSSCFLAFLTLNVLNSEEVGGVLKKVLVVAFTFFYALGAIAKVFLISEKKRIYGERIKSELIRSSLNGDILKRQSFIVYKSYLDVAQYVNIISVCSLFCVALSLSGGSEEEKKTEVQGIALSTIIFFSCWFVGEVANCSGIERRYFSDEK